MSGERCGMTDPVRCVPSPPRANSRSKDLAPGWIHPFPRGILPRGPCPSRISLLDPAAGKSGHPASVTKKLSPPSWAPQMLIIQVGCFFFPPPAQRFIPFLGGGRARDQPRISPTSSSRNQPPAFPEPPLRGLRALLKTSLFPHVCRCNLCTMPLLVEKQGLYLRGNYTCQNPALSLPAREALHDKSPTPALPQPCKSFLYFSCRRG